MKLQTWLASCFAVALLAPAVALANDNLEVNVGMGMGGANFGINIDIKDGTQGKRRQGNPQEVRVETKNREVVRGATPGEVFELVYEETDNRSTGFKVLEPEGYRLRVTEGRKVPLKQDSIPTSFAAQGGTFYRFEIFAQGVTVFDKKFEAKAGMMGTLYVTVSQAPQVVVVVQEPEPVVAVSVPVCMDSRDLSAIKGEIAGASFSDDKLAVLEDAMRQRAICGDQVTEFLALFSFSDDKLSALGLMAPRIIDPENNFNIYRAFTFSDDKNKAKKILSR